MRRLGRPIPELMKSALKVIGSAVAAAAGAYGGYVVLTYVRFGRVSGEAARKPLLDQVIPEYEVRERHSVNVAAPAKAGLTGLVARLRALAPR